jgi:hypothetical protein
LLSTLLASKNEIPRSSSTDNCSTPAPIATGSDNITMLRIAGVQSPARKSNRNPTARSDGSSISTCATPATSTNSDTK